MTYSKEKALETIFKPGKIKILSKIENSEPLSNTETMYYYRSIRPFILATQNSDLQEYLRKIDVIKKQKFSQRN